MSVRQPDCYLQLDVCWATRVKKVAAIVKKLQGSVLDIAIRGS